MSSERRRQLIAVAATLAILIPLGWLWQSSRLPSSYSVMDMGYPDYGGGSRSMSDHELMGRSVSSFVADPARPADVRFDLTEQRPAAREVRRTVGHRDAVERARARREAEFLVLVVALG